MGSERPSQLAILIRRARLTAGWSQEALAERSGVSVRTISDLERGTRTRPRLESIHMLADGLDLTADQRAALIGASRIELQDGIAPSLPDEDDRPAAVADRLDEPRNSFIGRNQDVAALIEMIRRGESRLITLTGPGGVGKTRLAMRVAGEIARDRRWRVHNVSLAPVTDPANVIGSICMALGVSGRGDESMLDGIVAALASSRTLLVLDNFERLVDAGPVLPELLSRCPRLTLLVTSRALLRLTDERQVPVGPLAIPADRAPVREVLSSPAVRLFLDRAERHHGTAAVESNEKQVAAIAAICRKLDGLPLAIELAAARTRMSDPMQLAELLESGIAILRHGPRDAPARLQSMHEMISWSYNLLTVDEQIAFRVASVFAGGFTFRSLADIIHAYISHAGTTESRQNAAGFDTWVADHILSLIDQSLIEQFTSDDGHPRFKLLESLREFGRQQLLELNELDIVCRLHAELFATLVRTRQPSLISQPKTQSDDPLYGEHDNARAAIAWAIEQGEIELAGWLACGLWPFWFRNGLYAEASDIFERILTNTMGMPPSLHADVLHNAGLNAHLQGDDDRCRTLADEALAIYEDLGNQAGIAQCYCLVGLSATNSDPVGAVAGFTSATEILRSLDDNAALSSALDGLGTALMHCGDVAGAKAAFLESMSLQSDYAEATGFAGLGWAELAQGNLDLAGRIIRDSLSADPFKTSSYKRAYALCLLGRIAFLRNDYREAAALYHEAISINDEIGAVLERNQCVAELAGLAQVLGDAERAVRWLAFDRSQREQLILYLTPDEASIRESALARAHVDLDEAGFAAAWASGTALSPDDATDEALEWLSDVRSGGVSAAGSSSPLTNREREVLAEVANGKTNREIAVDLFIGKSTVDTHVSSILSKLGVDSRRTAVRVARERGLLPQAE